MKKLLLTLVIASFIGLVNNVFGQQKALHFERNSCVDIPEITDLTGTAARTIEAWVRVPTSSLDWWQPTIIEWGQNSSGLKWSFRLDHYRLRVEHGGGYAIATTTLNDSLWHHVAVTADANSNITDVHFYIDGVEDPISDSKGGLIETGAGDFSIGRSIADDQSVRYWIGDIDEVRLWKKALTSEEISANMDKEVCVDDNADLVAYYKMNDGEGTTVTDETGNHDGTLASGKDDDGVPSWIDGVDMTAANCGGAMVTGTALNFERNSCVDIPEITDLTGTAARTIEAWVRVPISSLDWWQPSIIEWGQNSSGLKWSFRLDHYRLRVEHGGGYAIATTTLNDSVWHHVAVTAAASSNITDVHFYIDGVEDPISDSKGGLIETASGDFSIGRSIADDQSVRYWIGDMDDVRLWKKALTAEEISADMNSEVCVGDNPDLVAYYKFDDGEGTVVKDETGNHDGVLASGKDDDGLPTWIEGMTLMAANCNTTAVLDYTQDANALHVYPNPAGSSIHIQSSVRLERVAIYDLMGRKQLTITNFQSDVVDVSSLHSGIYFVRAFTADNQQLKTLKFIKK